MTDTPTKLTAEMITDGLIPAEPQLSPDGRFVCVSSLLDNHAAIFSAVSLQQTASIPTPKAPMGFGFAADNRHAYLCCHDDAGTLELELESGRVTRQFPTASGCEFVISY